MFLHIDLWDQHGHECFAAAQLCPVTCSGSSTSTMIGARSETAEVAAAAQARRQARRWVLLVPLRGGAAVMGAGAVDPGTVAAGGWATGWCTALAGAAGEGAAAMGAGAAGVAAVAGVPAACCAGTRTEVAAVGGCTGSWLVPARP